MRNFSYLEKEGFQETMVSQIPNFFDDALQWIREKLTPDDVFSDKELESWAESNGYKKEE